MQGIAQNPVKQGIVEGIIVMANRLQIELIAEGIEQLDDMKVLADMGVRYHQGYLLARPVIESLPEIAPEAQFK